MSRIQWRMACNVRCPDGTLLQKGDRVEWFNTRYHRGRIPLAQIETAMITARQLALRANGRAWLQPVTILHGERLQVIERNCLTMLVVPPPAHDRPREAPRLRQKELLD
ncbi:hypothetical protein [Planctellipticum variicoloris]|uniref:hypothetical protein n=1 Tax=Planctellipticum variicoloris TaxID=3064265 RepID=UPI003013D556|nr:hypothetical protein SH412_001985 [Planctomycetaceae bacterium SH412]